MIYYQCNMIIHKRDYSELHLRVNACTCLPSSYPITTPFSTQVYKWVVVNLMLVVTLR